MSNDLFAAEKQILEQAEQHLDAADLAPEAFAALLKGYEKLLRRTRRLVKMSDRSEAEIRRLSDEQSILNSILSEQNGKLEALSIKLSKYLSPQVYESIFSGKAEVRVGADRKFLTVFFSDIASFTEITDQLEPEILTRSLNAYLNEMAQIAIANGATIDKYIGDAVMAFFGDPETEGDNSGLSMHIKKDFDGMTLESISSFRNTFSYSVQDVDFDGGSLVNPSPISNDRDAVSQEFRLYSNDNEKLNWLIGGYYYQEDMAFNESIYLGPLWRNYIEAYLAPGTFAGLELSLGLPSGAIYGEGQGGTETASQDNETTSLFMQLDYNVTDRLNALVGVSYIEDEKTVASSST